MLTGITARREGLTGFVRNLDEGRVEAVAEGDADAIARFERALWEGPPLARVDDVRRETHLAEGRGVEFRIR